MFQREPGGTTLKIRRRLPEPLLRICYKLRKHSREEKPNEQKSKLALSQPTTITLILADYAK